MLFKGLKTLSESSDKLVFSFILFQDKRLELQFSIKQNSLYNQLKLTKLLAKIWVTFRLRSTP